MELIPFLIFAFIAFNVFKGFTKSSKPKATSSPKDLMQRLSEQMERANHNTSQKTRYQNMSPTQRGRESLQNKGQSPWGENGAVSPGARVAANYLQKSQAARKKARKDSHKSPEQRGRRGRNVDQNRNRTDEWGQRGDNGLLSGRNLIILLVVGGGALYVLSKMPAT